MCVRDVLETPPAASRERPRNVIQVPVLIRVNPSMYRIHDVDAVRYTARRAVAGAAVMGLMMSPYAQAVPPT